MTGTTGHAGNAALERFVAEDHEVLALVRPHHAESLAPRSGVQWITATFEETDLISDAAGLQTLLFTLVRLTTARCNALIEE